MSNVLTHHICCILSEGFYDFDQYFSSSSELEANAPKHYYLNSIFQINRFVKHSFTRLVSPLSKIKAYWI